MIQKRLFDQLSDGTPVHAYDLSAGAYAATILDYGGIIQSIRVPDASGKTVDVCLGYDNVTDYCTHGGYLGALIGRVGNRIRLGKFTLNGKDYDVAVNNGVNHLHGGDKGFNAYVWDAKVEGNELVLNHFSPDGDENYPGNLSVTVKYAMSEDGGLSIEYFAKSDADTLCNLTNHCYFNMNGEGNGTILNNILTLYCSEYTPVDQTSIPLGEHAKVEGTAFDFRTPKTIGRDIEKQEEQLANTGGYDHNFHIDNADGSLKLFAVALGEETGIKMEAFTTQPDVQFYCGNFLNGEPGKSAPYLKRFGFCLETQCPPDCINHPALGNYTLKANELYHTKTVYRFSLYR